MTYTVERTHTYNTTGWLGQREAGTRLDCCIFRAGSAVVGDGARHGMFFAEFRDRGKWGDCDVAAMLGTLHTYTHISADSEL